MIHIPKTGGSAIRLALDLPQFGVHKMYHQFRDTLGDQFGQYFTFAFVRNPWSRFVSFYNYVRMEENQYHSVHHPEQALYGKNRFYDLFIKCDFSEAVHHLINGRLRHYKSQVFFLMDPQFKWVCDENGHVLVDFLGRFESLDQDYAKICSHLHLPNHPLQKINSSGAQPNAYRDYYNAETKHLISCYYEEDIDIFQYTF